MEVVGNGEFPGRFLRGRHRGVVFVPSVSPHGRRVALFTRRHGRSGKVRQSINPKCERFTSSGPHSRTDQNFILSEEEDEDVEEEEIIL